MDPLATASAVPAFENLDQLEAMAKAKMAGMAFDYVSSGSEDEAALRGNRDGFARLRLRPRVLVDVSGLDLRTRILGTDVAMPILREQLPKELAGTDFEIYAYQVSGEARRLGTAQDPTLEYEPWKRGAYWALACHPTECFVIAATRVL